MTSSTQVRFFGKGFPAAATLATAILFGLTGMAPQAAQAGSFTILHNFSGASDGSAPYAGLTMDRTGNLYGTTSRGGAGYGTVYQLSRSGSGWNMTTLYSFRGGNDGAQPVARVIIGPDGTLYGTTFQGGGNHGPGGACDSGPGGCGTVFNLRPASGICKSAHCSGGGGGWTETVLYRFTGNTDGNLPVGDLLFDQAGDIYGTTNIGGHPHSCGGPGCGVVYKLTHSGSAWTQAPIYQFAPPADGAYPNGGVISDASGNLYGITYGGGSTGFGTVFELTHSGSGWTKRIVYTFQNASDGKYPDSGLKFGPDGNLYGTTTMGGTGGGGAAFKLTTSGGLSAHYDLSGGLGPINGNLVMDEFNDLYGTTQQDGSHRNGSVFKLTPSGGGWTYTPLHDFTGGSDGGNLQSNVVFDASGSLYGTATLGGSHNLGVVFKIDP